MQEEFNLFASGQALETLCAWSDNLKTFQQRIGKYFARSEAKKAACDYIQALHCPVERKNGAANGRTSRIHQSLSLAALVRESEVG
jgi:hypothetical protein